MMINTNPSIVSNCRCILLARAKDKFILLLLFEFASTATSNLKVVTELKIVIKLKRNVYLPKSSGDNFIIINGVINSEINCPKEVRLIKAISFFN